MENTHKITDYTSIAIRGFGIEGQSTYHFLINELDIPAKNISVLDQKKITTDKGQATQIIHADTKLFTEAQYNKQLQKLNTFDCLITSGGISPLRKEVQDYVRQAGHQTTHMQLFFEHYKGKLISITGTKGKSTTSQLIYNIMKRAGLSVEILGNIGKAALTSINRQHPPEFVVAELSSYMLEQTSPSSHIAIITNLYHEHHAQRHGGQEQYHQAKRNISKNTQHILLGSQIQKKPEMKTDSKTEIFGYRGKYTIKAHQNILKDIKLLGDHNKYNACAAIAVADILKIDQRHLIDELQDFGGIEHRLEYVGQYNKIHRYNDAIASTPESTIAALLALPQTETLFLGGKDGGYSFEGIKQTLNKSKVKNIVFYPATGVNRQKEIPTHINSYYSEKLEEGIDRANKHTSPNTIALLSCGAAYTLDLPFVQKGNSFKKHVKTL